MGGAKFYPNETTLYTIYIYIYDYIVICRVFAEYQHLRESCVDPEDPRFMPLGITLTEAYVMIQGADREA